MLCLVLPPVGVSLILAAKVTSLKDRDKLFQPGNVIPGEMFSHTFFLKWVKIADLQAHDGVASQRILSL